MSLDPDYLTYAQRQYGMDHDRYDWSMLGDRKAVTWPGEAPLALWVNVSVQFFPLNQQGKPVSPPGGLSMPYPDLRHFTLRDYGNRVGIFRILDALSARGIKASFAVNGQMAERAPALLKELAACGEIIAHGWNMDCPHYGGQAIDEERELVTRTLGTLRDATGQEVAGWLSPGRNESENTPELIAEQGVSYVCDWVNDDMPYPFRTDKGSLVALPLSTELEDRFVIQNNLHSEQSWSEQVCDAADFLLAEGRAQGGRLLALSVHPWMLGQPHRIGFFETVLDYLVAQDGVYSASPDELVAHWQEQQ